MNGRRIVALVVAALIFETLIVMAIMAIVAIGRGQPQPLYVCCTAAGGCEPKPPSECTGDLFWCSVGESTTAAGLPAVICHDGDP